MGRAVDEDLAARQIGAERLASRFGGDGKRVDDPGNRIGRNRRRFVQAQAAVRLGDDEVRERSAGVDRETKTAPTQTPLPPIYPNSIPRTGDRALAQERQIVPLGEDLGAHG